MLTFCSFIVRHFPQIFGTCDFISGLSFVGDGLSLVFECVYTVKSRLICLARMLSSVHGTSEDQWALYCA